jgi:hypothetical protein
MSLRGKEQPELCPEPSEGTHEIATPDRSPGQALLKGLLAMTNVNNYEQQQLQSVLNTA